MQQTLKQHMICNFHKSVSVILIIMSLCLSAAGSPDKPYTWKKFPSANAAAELTRLAEQLAQAKTDLTQIQQTAFQENPNLEIASKGVQEAESLRKANAEGHKRVHQYLEDRKDYPKVLQDYVSLTKAWRAVVDYKMAQEAAKDPNRRPFIEYLAHVYVVPAINAPPDPNSSAISSLVGDSDDNEPQPYTQPSSSDGILPTYLGMLKQRAASANASIDQITPNSQFPDFVIEQFKPRAKQSVLHRMYAIYVRMNAPKQLEIAQKNVREIEAHMTRIWPYWREMTRQAHQIMSEQLSPASVIQALDSVPSAAATQPGQSSLAMGKKDVPGSGNISPAPKQPSTGTARTERSFNWGWIAACVVGVIVLFGMVGVVRSKRQR